jgi:hypothetical protein
MRNSTFYTNELKVFNQGHSSLHSYTNVHGANDSEMLVDNDGSPINKNNLAGALTQRGDMTTRASENFKSQQSHQ